MRYQYSDPSDPFAALRGFGQSASASEAVSVVQRALKAHALDTGNSDYDPGPVDGLYGRNTHAAILRIARDVLEPVVFSTAEMRSTCNTLRSEAKAACQDYIGTMLRGMNQTIPGLSLSADQIEEVQTAYVLFLEAYITEYGEGGELDPAQIARREDVPLEEAEQLADARAAVQDQAAETAVDDATRVAVQTQDQAQQVLQPRLAGWRGWVGVLLLLGIGGAAIKMYYDGRKARALPRGR